MVKFRIKKGDKVVVIAGKDKNKTGRVLAVFPKKQRVLVEGVNIIKRHTKPNPKYPEGGIIEREAPIHISNVMIADPKTGEPTRVGFKFLEDGRKVRYAKKSGEILDE
ncbi:50S ribosomal protein L24 [Alicyclobacillus cellulosilyticus]|uniref:Large ribosomal subunit protein uL24 n=1 Tax=Alicyclobacillus cellulosilyticus TaxID=1003997 RepID=A0A917NHH6_9BACL|nr:50S ribosomal protein L24 [Alicyclobacillus cellulosilyticus]GGJ00995.1 50S ribosomal protein L24 [Alicyclobacillus cellulosilyticus]